MLNLTDEQIDEAALRMAKETVREEADVEVGMAYAWTKRRAKVRAAVREFNSSILDPHPSALSRAWEAAGGEGQVVS